MGIQGLWSVLEPIAQPVTLESLEGKRLAIDISLWLHQAAHGYTEHQLNVKNPHLSLVIRRLSKLLFYKIRPFFVFDGPNVPVFKKKILRDRQVRRYVEELTMTKAQKRALHQLAFSQLTGEEHSVDELKAAFASQTKKRRSDDDMYNVGPSTSRSESKIDEPNLSEDELEVLYSSFESSRSSEFDQAEYDSLCTRDERVDYLLAARDKVRSGLKLREIPDDSKAFSNLQIDRLLKRNRINEQLQLVKNEALKQKVFSMGDGTSYSDANIKFAALEGLDRVHIITEDNDLQIIDEEKETRKKRVVDSLAWPTFIEQMKKEEMTDVEMAIKTDEQKSETASYVGDDDDNDDALQEAIHASLLDEIILKRRVPMGSFGNESKGDMVERLRTAFAERARDLQHDNWSSTSSEIDDDFVDVSDPPECSSMMAHNISEPKITDLPTKKMLGDEKRHVHEQDEDAKQTDGEETKSKHIDRDSEVDIFAVAREEGVYKDCQDLLRICGIPFVVAPGEAEAQCCELERLGLVHGVISDDSDVWLFGASVVYRNMFNQKRRLQMYSKEAIQNRLGLSRWEAVQIALLSGGDYTNGLEGVGVVTALELISEFAISRAVDTEPEQEDLPKSYPLLDTVPLNLELLLRVRDEEAFSNLQRISLWLNHRGHEMKYDNLPCASGDNKSEEHNDDVVNKKSAENARRRKLRRLIEKNNAPEILESFPSRDVFDAYAAPLVDRSTEKPKWRTVNMEELGAFVWEKLGWDTKYLEQQTNKSLLKWNEYLNPEVGGSGKSYQMHITSFAHNLHKSEEDQRLAPTARVQAALQRLASIKNLQNKSSEDTLNLPVAGEQIKSAATGDNFKKRQLKKCSAKKNSGKQKKSTIVANSSRKILEKTELKLSEGSSDSDPA